MKWTVAYSWFTWFTSLLAVGMAIVYVVSTRDAIRDLKRRVNAIEQATPDGVIAVPLPEPLRIPPGGRVRFRIEVEPVEGPDDDEPPQREAHKAEGELNA